MKYTVKIADKSYEVEIEDIHARPIVAHVDGESFEVYPENRNKTEASKEAKETSSNELHEPLMSQVGTVTELTAPLPGTIVEIFVKAGDEVEIGNILLVIEAMKMKNSIRSTRTGKVTEVLVSPGETVAHKQALVRFE